MRKTQLKGLTPGPHRRLAKTPTIQRVCLSCDRSFASKHIGNRICPECIKTNAFSGGVL